VSSIALRARHVRSTRPLVWRFGAGDEVLLSARVPALTSLKELLGERLASNAG
jgi:hypothetical protein